MRFSRLQRRIMVALFVTDPEIINNSDYNLFELPFENTVSIYTHTELAKRVKANLSSVSRSLKLLRAAGLVTRRVSEYGLKKTALCLTDEGIRKANNFICDFYDKMPSYDGYLCWLKMKEEERW